MTGLNGRGGGAHLKNELRFVWAVDPRRIRLVAGLRQGVDAPDNPSRTQRPTDPTRVHTGIVGRTSTNERWQAEDGNYITKLPKAEHEAQEWQAAMEALILVATLGGPTMFARIGGLRALNRHVERVFNPDRKEHHWGRRKLARDR